MSEPVTFIKKRKGAPSGLRKKVEEATTSSTGAVDSPAESEVIIATKRATTSHLIQGTGRKNRNKDDTTSLALSDSDDDDDNIMNGGNGGQQNNKRQSYAVRHSAATSRPRRRSSSPPAEISGESIKAAMQNKLGQGQGLDKDDRAGAGAQDDGLYRGEAGQQHKLKKAFGPVKAGPSNVRTITLVDYQPDVCKDYKGGCGLARMHCERNSLTLLRSHDT